MTSFDAFSVSYHNDKYLHSTSKRLSDTGAWTSFNFNITGKKAVTGYFGIDFYTPRMYPKGCKLDSEGEKYMTNARMNVYRNGLFVNSTWVWDVENYGYLLNNWAPGNY